MLAVGFREAAVAFGYVGCYRQRRAMELVGQMVLSRRKLLGQIADLIRKVDRLLVDNQILESERLLHSLWMKSTRTNAKEIRHKKAECRLLSLEMGNRTFDLADWILPNRVFPGKTNGGMGT